MRPFNSGSLSENARLKFKRELKLSLTLTPFICIVFGMIMGFLASAASIGGAEHMVYLIVGMSLLIPLVFWLAYKKLFQKIDAL